MTPGALLLFRLSALSGAIVQAPGSRTLVAVDTRLLRADLTLDLESVVDFRRLLLLGLHPSVEATRPLVAGLFEVQLGRTSRLTVRGENVHHTRETRCAPGFYIVLDRWSLATA